MDAADFADKIILVTGAGKGFGRMIAEAFSSCGASIAAHDLTPINLDETIAHIQNKGGKAKDYLFDIAKKMPAQAMVEQVMADWGRIDILVNSLSVQPRNPILKMDEWDWHRTLDTNLAGPFFLIQSVGRVMQDLGGGVMINIAAAAEDAAFLSEHAAYYASMMGLIGLTRQAAIELAAYNIRVHAVCPRMSDEESLTGYIVLGSGERVKMQEIQGISDKVIQAVLFLSSPTASHLNGVCLDIKIEMN
jgi:NAD(P)-dependent dehydrogenase (short-subunit alcohol dehydrogenase family)